MCIESNILELLLPVSVTVAGWLVAGWYAVHQVNLAHKNNRMLQKEQDDRSTLSEIYKEFIRRYLETSMAITRFNSTMTNIHMNMMLNEQLTTIQINWEPLVAKLEQYHGEVGSQMMQMKTVYSSVKPYLPSNPDIQDAFKIYKDAFTFESMADKPYIKMQALLEGMQIGQNNNPALFLEHMKPIQKALKELNDKLKSYTYTVQERLLPRPNEE